MISASASGAGIGTGRKCSSQMTVMSEFGAGFCGRKNGEENNLRPIPVLHGAQILRRSTYPSTPRETWCPVKE